MTQADDTVRRREALTAPRR